MPRKTEPRRVCFVTGTRAEFGLMRSTLRAIAATPTLKLQIVATGMHLDPAYGRSVRQIRNEGWGVDATVPWRPARDADGVAAALGATTAGLARAFQKLSSDIVLVVGDRVEAFAAATAGHVSRRIVAHVHGGDRAEGQVDDSLRHAITKLAHLHFPATRASAERVRKLGEDAWRIHRVGSPGLDAIRAEAVSRQSVAKRLGRAGDEGRSAKGGYALMLLHPTDPDEEREFNRARQLLRAVRSAGFSRLVIGWPNNDPGSRGIIRCWEGLAGAAGVDLAVNLPRPVFLGLIRDAAVLVGNSSSGIIEAASFGTPVVDVGERQRGRERGENVTAVPFRQADLRAALGSVWNGGSPRRYPARNLYGGGNTGAKIAAVLAKAPVGDRLLRKLIAY